MFYTYFMLFFIYSVIGWLIEVTLALITEKKFINRGFLLGPYCPIYGCGCLLLHMILSKYQEDLIILFAMTFLICAALEYFTSWAMEKLFKMRWWDYTQMKFNLNGRICLETMIPFALFGGLSIKYVNPFFISLINATSPNVLAILTVILSCILVIDILISGNVIINLKSVVTSVKKDSTEDIKKAINKKFQEIPFMYKRVFKAFPSMSKIIKEQTEKTKKFFTIHKKSKKN